MILQLGMRSLSFPRKSKVYTNTNRRCRSFLTMATNLPSCFSIQFLEQLLRFLVNFTLFKYVISQRGYGFLITKEMIFGF